MEAWAEKHPMKACLKNAKFFLLAGFVLITAKWQQH
jgi:hypothetical protein